MVLSESIMFEAELSEVVQVFISIEVAILLHGGICCTKPTTSKTDLTCT